MTEIKSIGLVIRPGISAAAPLGAEVVQWAAKRGCTVYVDGPTERILAGLVSGAMVTSVWIEDIAVRSDVVVSLGGDGTLIGVARHITDRRCVMVGVHFGTLGFLTEIRPDELIAMLDQLEKGEAQIAQRQMLSCKVLRAGAEHFKSNAINDLVVQKGTKDRLLEIDISVDRQPLARVRADGLIIATPTGSTAYSLAAGGSIVHPELPVTLLTPICPHSLTIRPLIVPADSHLEVSFPKYEGDIFATADGQVSSQLKSSDTIVVTRGPNKVNFVRSPSRTYFDILTAKLNWGIPNRAH